MQVAELKKMVSALQQEKRDLEASLASMRIRAETSIKQLDEAHGQAAVVEDAAKTAKEGRKKAEEGRKRAEELVEAFRQAFRVKCTIFWSASGSKLRRWLARTQDLLNSSSSSASCDAAWP